MKIMYVDTSTDGHHLIYLSSLLDAASNDSFAVLPEGDSLPSGSCRKLPSVSIRTLQGYLKWMGRLKNLVEEERPDIIHFLDGDSIMRYFGIGFHKLCSDKIVITFHHLFPGKLREISMRCMLRQAAVGVFHTEDICRKVRKFGCSNISCIPYPCFLGVPMVEVQKQKVPPVLLALGGTRYDKGLDILLEALQSVTEPFRLVIAGKEEDFDEAFIREKIRLYREYVELHLHFLSEEELLKHLQNADIIVLPYRKIFDGASGPMCEGIYLGKTIVGPAHGSLGKMILEQHVGYTFESENPAALAKCLNQALKAPFMYDETAKKVQKELTPERFIEKYQELYKKL